MATISGLTTLAAADVASGDYLPIYDASAATDKKLAAGGIAVLPTANTFTAAQTINTAISSASLIVQRSGVDAVQLNALSGDRGVAMPSFDNSSSYGPYINIGRNSNASTPASGHIIIRNLSNQYYSLWVDASANLRIVAGAQPTNATDTAGTVVGTQTSSLDAKSITGAALPAVDILAAVQAGAEAVRRWTYRNGAFNGEEFSGVVVDYAPRYGMDRDDEHPAGKSLNVATIVGDLLIAVANLAERVAALEAERG